MRGGEWARERELTGFCLDFVDLQVCKDLMATFIKEKPEIWWEDVGEEGDETVPASEAPATSSS